MLPNLVFRITSAHTLSTSQDILAKAGKAEALGTLENNDPASDSDAESSDEIGEPANGAADDLADALARTKIQ